MTTILGYALLVFLCFGFAALVLVTADMIIGFVRRLR
jgi:hypothetical protein